MSEPRPATDAEQMILAERTIARLTTERDELAATVERLRAAGDKLCNFAWSGVTVSWNRKDRATEAEAYLQANIDDMRAALAATPAQNLAKVRAEALRAVVPMLQGYGRTSDTSDRALAFEEAHLYITSEAGRIEAEAAR